MMRGRRRPAAAMLVAMGAVAFATAGVAGPARAGAAVPAGAVTYATAGLAGAAPVSGARTVATRVAGARGVLPGRAGYPPFEAPGKTLRLGAKGAAVKALQVRLKELGYVPGSADGRYGGATLTAVWAFQKVQGIKPTSTVAARTWRALENPRAPRVLVPRGKATRVEVDLTKQVMVLYRSGVPVLISHISSGSGVPYTEYAVWNGKRQVFSGSARTPTGDYKTTWRARGWHRSYLGQLYNPIFFNGGIALHGALSVPLYPASHGCVRLPMNVAGILPGMLGKGVPVHVRGAFRR